MVDWASGDCGTDCLLMTGVAALKHPLDVGRESSELFRDKKAVGVPPIDFSRP